MVIAPPMAAFLAALSAGIVVALAEMLHARRTRRVAHLAFGPSGRPRVWTRAAPALRTIAAALTAWGLVVLFMLQPQIIETRPTKEASKHLLICLDGSPSMYVADAGPSGNEKRAVWAGALIQAILDRLDTETTRVTVFAIYTKALPVIEDTFDMNVVRNLLDGLPLVAAFEPGPTHLSDGVADAMEYARAWEPDSATLVVVSDGDAENRKPVRFVPASIADAIVIGVGNPARPTLVAGHRSKQNATTLRALAAQLGAVYHQGNTKHLPSSTLNQLTMIKPRVTDAITLREFALVAIALGATLLALIGPALSLFGRRGSHVSAVTSGGRRTANLPRPVESVAPAQGGGA